MAKELEEHFIQPTYNNLGILSSLSSPLLMLMVTESKGLEIHLEIFNSSQMRYLRGASGLMEQLL